MRNILVPHTGHDVPFVIKNYPYTDPFGRETVTFVREYRIKAKPTRFDATMVLVDGRVIDYLGTHQHLAVDIKLAVDDDGALVLRPTTKGFTKAESGSASHRCSAVRRRCTKATTMTPTCTACHLKSRTACSGSSSATTASSPATSHRPTTHPPNSSPSGTKRRT